MHKILPRYYYFIDSFNKDHIKNLDKNIAIIFRKYTKKLNINELIEIKKLCKSSNRRFFL